MRVSGAGAVMADRARGAVEGDDARAALHRRLEYFPTPPWAARAGGELIQALDPGPWWAWEPACGEGHLAHGLADYFDHVIATDIHEHPGSIRVGEPLDFLSPAADRIDAVDWIITNPPFNEAAEFVRVGLRRARRGVAILARLSFFESIGRFPLFFPDPAGGDTPLTVLAPFFERVPMVLGRWDPKASTATAYAWFVWMRPEHAPHQGCLVKPIPPGSKVHLSRPADAPKFARDHGPDLLSTMETQHG
jgi:hypothetical protein